MIAITKADVEHTGPDCLKGLVWRVTLGVYLPD